jgi:integrase
LYHLRFQELNMHRDMDRDTTQQAVRRSAPKPLTITAISALKPGRVLADGAIRPGAGSLKIRKRVTSGGTVAEWLFEWHRDGKATRQSIGRYAASEADNFLTLTQARAKAARLQATIMAGEDPAAQREIERAERKAHEAATVKKVRNASEKTFKALLDAYVSALRAKGKHRTASDVANIFKNHVEIAFPDLAALPAAQITPEHFSRILARLVGADVETKRGRTALKLRSYASAAFKLALGAATDPMAPPAAADFGLTYNAAAAVPAGKMAATFNRPGERVLTSEELGHYLVRIAALPSTLTRLALQLQIASAGQRFQQLLRLRHMDVSGETFVLFDPKGRRSQPRAHVLPIVDEVAEIFGVLRTINPMDNGDTASLLFASRGGGPVAAETLSSTVQEIAIAMVQADQSQSPFRGGDIRRTIETMLAETLRISKDTRAQLLSHGLSGVQDVVYDKGQHLHSKRAALRAWNDFIADLCIGSATDSNVVPLHFKAA